jgi:hypothetical protein
MCRAMAAAASRLGALAGAAVDCSAWRPRRSSIVFGMRTFVLALPSTWRPIVHRPGSRFPGFSNSCSALRRGDPGAFVEMCRTQVDAADTAGGNGAANINTQNR